MKSTETYTTVAAQPEWFLAIFDNTNGVHYEQIIAWEIRRTTAPNGLVSRSPIPITAEGNNVDLVCTEWAIKRPDGKFVLHSNDMSEELLSQVARLTEIESPKLRVGSPSIANGDPPKTPAPQSSLSSPKNPTAAYLTGPWLLEPGSPPGDPAPLGTKST